MPRVDLATLESRCSRPLCPSAALAAVDALGWLAPWWLRPGVIEAAASRQPAYAAYLERPILPTDPGGCWAVFVAGYSWPLLREAFLLPMRWRRGVDDPRLPAAIRRLADQVRRQFDGAGWGLVLATPEREEAIDLSPLDAVGESSAWASLAGGLLLAQDGLASDGKVWASAAWDETYGVARVDGVPAKLSLAREWEVRRMFVPAQNQQDIPPRGEPGLGDMQVSLLSPISPNGGSPPAARLLEPYLEDLGVEPDAEHSLDLKYRYYARVGRARSRDFYWNQLLDDAVARCAAGLPAERRPTHLVTVVSLEPAVVAMAPLALRVRHCLLLCTDRSDKRLSKVIDQVCSRLSEAEVTCHVGYIDHGRRDTELTSTSRQLEAFASGIPAEQLAFDLTPGFKPLTLALEAAAPRGSWLLYCRHEQQGTDNRIQPGTERYDCWRKTD